jgi:AcrR family transcriptional regulator
MGDQKKRGAGLPGRLAVVGGPPVVKERTDAARNRARILAAARKLMQARPIAEIQMDAVASEAGVGKGTVYRRFPDRTALCLAILDDDARALQDHVLAGLGLPAEASATRRIDALLTALFDFSWQSRALLAEAWGHQPGGPARLDHAGHRWMRESLIRLLALGARRRELAPIAQPELVVEQLLAALHPDLLSWFSARGLDQDTVRASFLGLARATLTARVGG